MTETQDAYVDRILPMVRRAEDSADDAVSPKGAIGRYQIMPNTARALGFDPAKLKDPAYNEVVARAAIRDLVGQHGQDDKAVLAGYNASPRAVNNWKRQGRNDRVLPAETQNYFKRAGYEDKPAAITYAPVSGPPGKQQYQKLLDSGFSKEEADAWAVDRAQKLRDGGFSEKEVSDFFDDAPYNNAPIEKLAKKQAGMIPPGEHEKVADNWVESFQAGMQSGVMGLAVRKPDIVEPEKDKESFAQTLAFQGGQLISDFPVMVAGAVAGSPAGPVGSFAAGAALPEAVRGALIDSYKNPEGHKTWADWSAAYGAVAWNAAKAATAGAAGGKVGMAAAGVVAKAGGSLVAKGAAFAAAQYPATVGAFAALEGQVPDAQDFTAGAALTIGLGLAGHSVGSVRRFIPSAATKAAEENMQDVYKRTGMSPAEMSELAKNDVVAKVEILSRNADGTQSTPTFDEAAPPQPEISREAAAARIAEIAKGMKSEELDADAVQKLAAEEFQKQIDSMLEPDPATAPISEERALAVRLKEIGEPEPTELVPAEGGKPPGGNEPPPPEIEGEFREVPRPKQIEEKMPLDTANKIVDNFIGEKPDKPRPWWNPITVYRQFFTELAQSRVLDKELGSDPRKAGVEDMLRQTYGSSGRAGYFVRYGSLRLSRDTRTGDVSYKETPGKSMFAAIAKAKELGGTEDGLVRYWVAARALALDKRGITSGLNSVAARRVIEETGSIYHPALKMMQENNHAVVDYVRDSGVFSAKRAKAMKDLNPFHIVFQRVVDPSYSPVGKGFGPRQPVKTIEGSERKIIPPIPAQVDNMHRMIAMADRNVAVGHVIDAIMKVPEKGKLALELKDTLDPKTLIEDVKGTPIFDEEGNAVPIGDREALAPFLAMRKFFGDRGPNDFLYFRDGKPEIWTAKDPETALMLRATQPGSEANVVTKIFEGFANISRLGIVSLPEFPIRTGIRSQFEAAVRSEHAGLPGHAWLQGIWHVFKQDKLFQQFMKDGGFNSSMVDIDEKYIQRDVTALFEKTGTWDRIKNTFAHPLEALHAFRAMMENAGKLGYWKFAKQAGLSGGKAAMQSRKAFGDSAEKAGLNWMNTWAKTTVFMRPSVLDVVYFAQAMRTRAPQVMAAGATLIMLPTIGNYIANKMYDEGKEDNPEYRAANPDYIPYSELPRWQKDMMLVFPPMYGVRIRFPAVPYTAGFFFHTGVERFLDYAYEHDPRAFKDWGHTFMAQFAPPFLPALALPIYEMQANTRQGSGTPLIPASVENASPDMMYTKNTTETAKMLSQTLGNVGVDIAPITLDNYVREWTGPIASQALRILDGSAAQDNRPWQVSDIPMVGAFVVRHPDMTAQPIEDFFGQMHLFNQKHADISLAIRNQDFSALPRTLQDPRGLMKMTTLTKVQRALSMQANILRAMDTSKMTNAEKQRYMDGVYTSMVQQAKVALEVLDSVPDTMK